MPNVAVSTGSMLPIYNGFQDTEVSEIYPFRGDILLIKKVPLDTLNVGDVIVFDTLSISDPVVHRIVAKWQNDTNFSGQQQIEISVQGSPLLMAYTVANYYVDTPSQEDQYAPFYQIEIGGIMYGDPLTNVKIDGKAYPSHPDDPTLPGQWWHLIPAGSTFTATLNVQASIVSAEV